MKLAGWVWIVALAGLGGCARFGDSRPAAEQISLPPMTQTLRDAQTGAWPVSDWWHQFGSPELSRLIETALADNPDLGVAAARLRQARALVDGQAAALYPTVSAMSLSVLIGFRPTAFRRNWQASSFGNY